MPKLTLAHDGPIDIATGKSRNETSWKNSTMLWSEFVTKLSTTTRTNETYKEYITAKKQLQDEKKDVGGYVAAVLTGGKRKKTSVLTRSMLTLDMDQGTPDFWDEFTMMYDCAALIHSTHKHCPENPRYRLIIPLDSEVDPAQYQAIARRLAGSLGIELFDPTTFQPERLMFWPSTSKDGSYFFQYQNGPFLNADSLLATYRDWRDCSQWPVSANVAALAQHDGTKQGDPLTKQGAIGAFCRTYPIEEAIDTFLGDVYSPCDVASRYTYKHGSTSGGLVTYDGLFAYSHHGTDPTQGKTCNAFDLVRIHLFGLQDLDVKPDTPINKLPSYLSMVDLAVTDPKVKIELIDGVTADFDDDFKEDLEDMEQVDSEPVNNEWKKKIELDRKGKKCPSLNNAVLHLENIPQLKGCVGLNSFNKRQEVCKRFPWQDNKHHRSGSLNARDESCLRLYLEAKQKLVVTDSTIRNALNVITERNVFNPLTEYLDSLTWDGTNRIDTLLVDYLGASNTDINHCFTRKTLIAAAARAISPGCKHDHVLTLIGAQGLGKSTLVRLLAHGYHSDSFSFELLKREKAASEHVQDAWIIEIGEMVGYRKSEDEANKNFLSRQDDIYRGAYERNTDCFKRHCIFIGTTNEANFLKESNGNRRYWPVVCGVVKPIKDVFTELTETVIGQIWAEAVAAYRQGEPWHLSDKMEAKAYAVQAKHEVIDPRIGTIENYLSTMVPDNWFEMGVYERRAWLAGDDLQPDGTHLMGAVSAVEIWCDVFDGRKKDVNGQNLKFIHNAMKKMQGWELSISVRNTKDYGKQFVYYRVENSEKTVKAS